MSKISVANTSQKTPLYDAHLEAGGKIVDFSGWQLPIHYGSQIDEHKAVRTAAGMFDVSHMTVVDVKGGDAQSWLRILLTNDVAKLSDGKALYSCMCNEQGGVLDDLIVYRLSETNYRVIVNSATREKDIAWMQKNKQGDVTIDVPTGLAMIAVQGPKAIAHVDTVVKKMLPDITTEQNLKRFSAKFIGDWFIARTGYTGEDGVEIVLPESSVQALWQALLDDGVRPAGLGARDTLRLEAGMHLYGNDLDEEHSAVECGLAWVVDCDDEQRHFIGREVLEDHKAFGGKFSVTGVVLEGRGVLRSGQVVQLAGQDIGIVTSGTFSPSLQKAIGMIRTSKPMTGSCDVVIRDKPIAARTVALPFIKGGQATFS